LLLRRRVFNLGGGWSPTVFEVAGLVADRCAQQLGTRAPITRVPPSEGESAPPLDYRIDALQQTGFQLKTDRIAELDGVLSFCLEAFGGSRG
jgi:hypothetical protein